MTAVREHVDVVNAVTRNYVDTQQHLTQMEIDHYKEEFQKLDRQSRMTELKLDDWTVVAHRGGLSLTGDYTRGPQGNLDEESFNLQEKVHGSRRRSTAAGSHSNRR